VAALRSLSEAVEVWGFGPAARTADRSLRRVLEDAPDLPREALLYLDLDPTRAQTVLPALKASYPRAAFVLDPRSVADAERDPRALVGDPAEGLAEWAARCRDLAELRRRVESLRELIDPARQVLVLTHPNPDPDAIAAALAMRSVLARDRRTCTLGYLGRPLTRPENVAMVDLLEIDLQRLEPDRLSKFDAIVLVDCQENLFAGLDLPAVTAVIDHHPEQAHYAAPYRDVVPEEGSTSTILTRYLQALQIEPSQRLATALLYGIKSDTLFLHREVADDDLAGFLYLYPRANVNLLRRIEAPELSADRLRLLGSALAQARVVGEIVVAGIAVAGAREDLAARLADLGLQVEGATWSLAWIQADDELVISVRNVGWVKHAGRAVAAAWGRFGPAGGHRSAARAIMPLTAAREELGKDPDRALLEDWIVARLAEAIRPDDEA
jgi:nanoRNase/pAp phosphatase (c-di-AMP/oligoRNAs hydrolase)